MSVTTALLCLAPTTLQLIFACGLRKDKHAAYFGTLISQLVFSLLTVAVTGVALTQDADGNRMARPEPVTTASPLLVPMILNATLHITMWWIRRSLTIHVEPSTTSTLLRRWLLLMVGCVSAVLVFRFLTGDSSIPLRALGSGDDPTVIGNTTPLQTLHDYTLTLLPTAIASIFEPSLVPMTLFAEIPVLWVPLVTWGGTLAITLNALFAWPRIPLSSLLESLTPLLRAHGAGTLGWMQAWEGNQVWVSPTGEAGVAYCGPGGATLAVTDLAYRPGKAPEVIALLSAFTSDLGLTSALCSVHEEPAQATRKEG